MVFYDITVAPLSQISYLHCNKPLHKAHESSNVHLFCTLRPHWLGLLSLVGICGMATSLQVHWWNGWHYCSWGLCVATCCCLSYFFLLFSGAQKQWKVNRTWATTIYRWHKTVHLKEPQTITAEHHSNLPISKWHHLSKPVVHLRVLHSNVKPYMGNLTPINHWIHHSSCLIMVHKPSCAALYCAFYTNTGLFVYSPPQIWISNCY